jgi:hypothetical protein
VNVTLCPKQTVDPALFVMLTEVRTVGLTVMVTLLLFAAEVVTQFSDDVSVQVITSPLFREDEL